IKTYREREKHGSKEQESAKGPHESKIMALLERTRYTLDVTTGQRKYGGPPSEAVFSGPVEWALRQGVTFEWCFIVQFCMNRRFKSPLW
uniref:Uncharacterized protein n=1 Tax=Scleropages formosus TaxID=113540 RepID=A0A8C9TLE8_SCLFO